MSGLLRNRTIILVFLGLIALCLVGYLQLRGERYQRDFTTFYAAATVYADGGDPYDLTALQQAAAADILPYLYPPLTLPIFRVFTILPLSAARTVWLWLRAGILIGLLWIWRKMIHSDGSGATFYILALFAFGGAIFLDLKAGNVSIIEQFLLWSGFYFLLTDRPGLFCTGVVAASVLKGAPILFLLLLPLLGSRRAWTYLTRSVVAFGLFQIVNYLAYPSMYLEYISKAVSWDERAAQTNPSALALLKDLGDWFAAHGLSLQFAHLLSLFAYAIIALAVLLVSHRIYREIRRTPIETTSDSFKQKLALIYLSTLVYGLLVPRFKLYSFILVLPAAFYVIRKYASASAVLIWVVLLSLPAHPAFPMPPQFLANFWLYYPLGTLFLLWGVWATHCKQSRIDERVLAPSQTVRFEP